MRTNESNQAETFEAFTGLYPDEWVLVQVTEENDLNEPKKGIVIAHSRIKEEIIARSKGLKGDFAVFFTGAIPKKGYAFCFTAREG